MCTLNLLASAANISSYVKVDSAGIVGDNSINQPVITSQLPKYGVIALRSEEHTSEFQSRETISYAVFCLKKKNTT
jgi:hypothetical protein